MSEPTPELETQAGDDLLAELADDFLRRYRAGEHPSVKEYAAKHPELADRIRDLFPAVIVMERPDAGATLDFAPAAERVGEVIGRYKLLERIGEGGFGVVYMAEQQQPVRRKVALKVIKPGTDTWQVIARFEAERQALALMDHENIAKVLDAGATDSGRPYFVMELVRGVPITDFCDANQLPPRERLELFVKVCRAVQHAHTKGIIHRDIKPTNVLVTLHEGRPVPKVIDFGVAKATGQQLTDKTLFTQFAQMVGTPLYMSPEQAEMTSIDVDTRSDVYSLGVLLYELLTGTTPLDNERLKQAAFDEVRRMIREDEPPRPSTRFSTMGEQARSVSAAHRNSDPKLLGRLVRGELDWIVMKALDKERARRYDTASAFAADVERYLNDEQVQACPPSAWYRFRKFARRNRAALTAASLFVVMLGAGAAVSTWQAIRATKAEEQALVQAAKAQTVSGLLQDMLASAHPDQLKGADYTVRELLDEFSERLDKQLKEQPEVEATLRLIMGTAYWRLAVLDKSERHFTAALALRRQVFGEEHEQVAEILVEYAWTLRDMGQAEESLARAREALAIYRQRDVRGRPLIKAMWTVQAFLTWQGKHAEADALGREALAIARESPDGEYPEVASIMNDLAFSKLSQGQAREAEQLAREALPRHLRLHGKEHPATGWGEWTLGMALQAQGKYPEAATHLREALAIFRKHHRYGHYSHTFAFDNLLSVLQAQGNEKEVQALLRQRLADTTKAVELTPEDPETWFQRGVAHAGLHRHNEAIADYEKVISLLEQLPTFPSKREQRLLHAGAYSELANSYAAQGRYAEAVKLYEETLASRKDKPGADRFDTAQSLNNLAWLLAVCPDAKTRDPRRAVTLAERAVKLEPAGGFLWQTLAVAHYRAGDWEAAVAALDKSISLGKGEDDRCLDWFFLAMAHWQMGDKDEARKWYEQGIEWMEKNNAGDEKLRHFRAEAADLMGIKDGARKWYEQGIEWIKKNSAGNERLRQFRAEPAEIMGIGDSQTSPSPPPPVR